MSPVNMGDMSRWLGPGTGGLFMGEQQRNAMQESELGQQLSLEQIATAKANRDMSTQKLPLELEKMRNENAMHPGKLEELTLKNEESKAKISRQAYQDYLTDLAQLPMDATLEDKLAWVNQANKKHKMDAENPMSMMAVRSLQNPEQFKKLFDAITLGDPANRAKMAEREMIEGGLDRRNRETRQSAEGIAAGNNRTQIEVANIRKAQALETAKARAGQGDQAMKNKSYAQAYNYYKAAADAAAEAGESPQVVQQLMTRAQEALAADTAARGASANTPKAGGVTVTPGGELQPRPAQPLPQSVPPLSPQQSAARGENTVPKTIEEAVKAAGQTYDPSKYDYRIGPNGEVQRKAK